MEVVNMSLSKNDLVKNIAILASPLLMFAILLIPYSWANQQFIVEWFGCGCPKLDEFGNTISPDFNANDFTALFWLFISVCVTTISAFLSKKISKKYWWLRIVYIVGMLALSLLIASHFTRLLALN